MSGFGAFESNFNDHIQDVDPAADFLAREQDVLAEIEDEGFINNNIEQPQDGFVDYNGVSEETDLSAFEMINDEQFQDEQQLNGFSEPVTVQAPFPSRPIIREEAEKVKKWREEQQKWLEQKDAEEDKKKEELRESAKKELDDWYKLYSEQVVKIKASNRNAEREYVMERDSDTPGQEWERIAKLCDFNPKSSKHAKDVSRMRSIILQLKQSPVIKK